MSFRYNGGDCSQSFNIQPRTQFECDDFNGGPPSEEGVVAYIQAFDLRGGDVYFEGFVPVGEIFTLVADGTVSANMNITMWDPKGETDPNLIVSAANIMQTNKYHSSCSRNLFLKDRFGSAQLVEFISDDQGLITCFINATLALDIQIPIFTNGDSVRLTALTMLTNLLGIIDKTEEVNGVIVGNGEVYEPIPIEITLDLTVRQRYTFFTTIVGETVSGGAECNGNDFFEFVAGNPLPPIFPTIAPSASPTITPFPTPDPNTSPCELDANIRCVVTDGPTNNCQQLTAPVTTVCSGTNIVLTSLRFQYTGGNCGTFENCEDRNGGPSGAETVVIEVSDRDGAYYEETTTLDTFFDVQNPTGFDRGRIEIEIFAFNADKKENKGGRLQTVEVSIECDEPELVLGNEYGGVTLVAFENDQDGLQTLYAEVQIAYSISNPAVFDALVTSAIVSSFFSGPGQQFISGAPLRVERFDDTTLLTESRLINLEEAAGQPAFVFGFNVQGVADTSAQLACTDFPVLFFNVQTSP
jgi:hypothetical protein